MASADCTDCGKQLKSGAFGGNVWSVNESVMPLLELAAGPGVSGLCRACLAARLAKAESRRSDLENRVNANLKTQIPLATIESPFGWNYEVRGFVTHQTVSGTGLFTELASLGTDMVGGQSRSLAEKLNNGERMCAAELRIKALLLGANAILGVDIDYAEVGGVKAMLMVCMSGTAVWLKSVNQEPHPIVAYNELVADSNQLVKLRQLNINDLRERVG